MAKQSSGQRKTVGRVMHEWKHGELESSRGGKVKGRRQAVAIALSEFGFVEPAVAWPEPAAAGADESEGAPQPDCAAAQGGPFVDAAFIRTDACATLPAGAAAEDRRPFANEQSTVAAGLVPIGFGQSGVGRLRYCGPGTFDLHVHPVGLFLG